VCREHNFFSTSSALQFILESGPPGTRTPTTPAPCRLGGVVVSLLAIGPKGRGFEPGQGDGFLRAIKIRSTPSFGWEVKTEVPCRKIIIIIIASWIRRISCSGLWYCRVSPWSSWSIHVSFSIWCLTSALNLS
jgi:hypothetical protein